MKLLIINKAPFGMLVDQYKWCEYAKDALDITCLSFARPSGENTKMEGLRTINVPYVGNYAFRGLLFVMYAIFVSLFFPGKIMIVYFEHCEWIKKFLFWKKMFLDIRTLSVSSDEVLNEKRDKALRHTAKFFDYVTVISEGVCKKLMLPQNNSFILPLGADVISENPKQYDNLKLLYVGTLDNRDIEKTIKGFHLFLNTVKDKNITYDIVGDGYANEKNELQALVDEYALNDKVKVHGRIEHTLLKPFFDNCNIGISFIPMTDYYRHQPPTKTYEYIFSGLYCVATATEENKKVINSTNGILINDTPESFAQALSQIYNNRKKINESGIRKSALCFHWKNIVENKFINLFSN